MIKIFTYFSKGGNHENLPSNDQQVTDEMTLGSASLLGRFICSFSATPLYLLYAVVVFTHSAPVL